MLLEVGRELSCFCEMTRRSNVVGPRWSTLVHLKWHEIKAKEFDMMVVAPHMRHDLQHERFLPFVFGVIVLFNFGRTIRP